MNANTGFKVFILDSAAVPHGEDDTIERQILSDCAEVITLRLDSEQDFMPYSDQADAVILWHHLELGAYILGRLTRTKIIVRNGVGFDNVDIRAAAEAGIAVSNVPDYGTEEVADHAVGLSLALLRQIKSLDRNVAQGSWEWRAGLSVRRLSSLRFGIVGCGRIGTAVASRAKAFGFQVQFFDPYLASGYEKAIGTRRVFTLDSLLQTSDIVSIHTPLTPQTRHLIGSRELALMHPSAYLVNTARGGVISSAALLHALQEGRLAGAGLDVLDDEPALASDFAALPQCIVTPHSAFYSSESLLEMRQKSAHIVREALLNNVYQNVVNR